MSIRRNCASTSSSRKGFVWVKRAVTPKQQQDVYHLGLPGIGFMQENKRVYPNGPIAAHVLGYANLDGIGISGLEKYIDGAGLADLHGAGFNLTHRRSEADRHFARSQGDLCGARRTRQGHRQIQGQGRRRGDPRRQHRRSHRDGLAAGLRPEQSRRCARSRPHQPDDSRRLRDGLDLQGADDRHGARFRQGQSQFANRRARVAALRPFHHPRFPRRSTGF